MDEAAVVVAAEAAAAAADPGEAGISSSQAVRWDAPSRLRSCSRRGQTMLFRFSWAAFDRVSALLAAWHPVVMQWHDDVPLL